MKTPKKPKANDPGKAKAISDQAVEIAQWAATALIAAEQLGLKDRPLEHFYLSPGQRDVLLLVPGISKTIKTKLAEKEPSFTAAEVGGMMMAVAEEMPDCEDTRCALRANGPARPRTLVERGATRNTWRLWPTRSMKNTSRTWSGEARLTRRSSTPRQPPKRCERVCRIGETSSGFRGRP